MTGQERQRRHPTATVPWVRHRPGWSLALSVLAHAVLLVLILRGATAVLDDGTDAGPGQGRGGGGGGGGRTVTYIAMQAPPAVAAAPIEHVPPPVTAPQLPTRPVVRTISTPVTTPVSVRLLARPLPMAKVEGSGVGLSGGPGSGTGTGGGVGSGTGTGEGSGEGPGQGGDGGAFFPPSVRFTALPPADNRPESVVGKSFLVYFDVNVRGRVVRVRVEPEIPDPGYRKKFLEAMRRYRFNPAVRRDGTAIPGRAVVTITL